MKNGFFLDDYNLKKKDDLSKILPIVSELFVKIKKKIKKIKV